MEFDARVKEPDKVGWDCKVIMPDGARKPSDIRLIQNAFDLSEPFIY